MQCCGCGGGLVGAMTAAHVQEHPRNIPGKHFPGNGTAGVIAAHAAGENHDASNQHGTREQLDGCNLAGTREDLQANQNDDQGKGKPHAVGLERTALGYLTQQVKAAIGRMGLGKTGHRVNEQHITGLETNIFQFLTDARQAMGANGKQYTTICLLEVDGAGSLAHQGRMIGHDCLNQDTTHDVDLGLIDEVLLGETHARVAAQCLDAVESARDDELVVGLD